uniref:SAM domain-containing protein n=1 Tax=Haptolina brevifila TaxID=156173 RepID=A0A7S2NCQ8_9EUKA|mmetsp:Transcript_73736/g.146648  ORF Transcript_73736/g.146648 Transcript_73736/m.146648 type:complete len:215 (+) Transcript_73736:106-750(+)
MWDISPAAGSPSDKSRRCSFSPTGCRSSVRRRSSFTSDTQEASPLVGELPTPSSPPPSSLSRKTGSTRQVDAASAFMAYADQKGFGDYVPAMVEMGYDRVFTIEVIAPAAAEELIKTLGMKPGHAEALRAIASQNGEGGVAARIPLISSSTLLDAFDHRAQESIATTTTLESSSLWEPSRMSNRERRSSPLEALEAFGGATRKSSAAFGAAFDA